MEQAMRDLERHKNDYRDAREMYQYICSKASNEPGVSSVACDAATQSKHRLPLTQEFSKKTSRMHKIQQKLTGVVVHGIGYYLFRTLPWIRSGANLTLTILFSLFSLGLFDSTHTLYVQWDGAKDNVNVTNFYALAWLLMVADSIGLCLSKIIVSRLEVGHTHFDVDAYHGILSKYLHGCVKTNDSRRSVHTARSFKEHMFQCYPSLAAFVEVERCWDFDKFLKTMSSTGLPRVTELMMVELEVRDGAVWIRTKPRMAHDNKVPWTTARQFYPDPDHPRDRPRDDVKPDKASYRKVDQWKKVVRDVTAWCHGRGTVRPSPRDSHQMLHDLETWGKRPHRTLNLDPPAFPVFVRHRTTAATRTTTAAATTAAARAPAAARPVAPFRPRPQCKCGSFTHKRTNHRDCPLNPRNRRRRRSRSTSRTRSTRRDRNRRRNRRRQDRSRSRGRDRSPDSATFTPPPTSPPCESTTPQSTPQPTPQSPPPTPTSTSLNSGGDDVVDADLIGVKVRKQFGSEWFDGEVISVSEPGIFKVKYEDSDSEELDKFEVFKFELNYEQHYLLN